MPKLVGRWKVIVREGLGRVGPGSDPRPVPQWVVDWYDSIMLGTYTVTVGDRGRVVIPAELRGRVGFSEGATLVLVETARGVLVVTREQLRDLVRDDLRGLDLVSDLLAARRREALIEDAA